MEFLFWDSAYGRADTRWTEDIIDQVSQETDAIIETSVPVQGMPGYVNHTDKLDKHNTDTASSAQYQRYS